MDGIMHGCIERCLYGTKVGWMDGWIHITKTLSYKNTGEPLVGFSNFIFSLDRWMDECINGGMDKSTDEQTDGSMPDGWIDGSMDGG